MVDALADKSVCRPSQCVDAETPTFELNADTTRWFELAFACPGEYPFEGAFSGNPTWLDQSYTGMAAVKAVASNGLAAQKDWDGVGLSYAGTVISPGYVSIKAAVLGDGGLVQGRYQCSNSPANPR